MSQHSTMERDAWTLVAVAAAVLLAGSVGYFLGFMSGFDEGYTTFEPATDEEFVHCYIWAENGSGQAMCFQSPGVNLTIEPCSAYEIQLDEEVPCETVSGEMNLSGLPVEDTYKTNRGEDA